MEVKTQIRAYKVYLGTIQRARKVAESKYGTDHPATQALAYEALEMDTEIKQLEAQPLQPTPIEQAAKESKK